MGCKCEQYIRWIRYPAMAEQYSPVTFSPVTFEKVRTPVKPSLRKPARWRKLR